MCISQQGNWKLLMTSNQLSFQYVFLGDPCLWPMVLVVLSAAEFKLGTDNESESV